MVFKFLMKNSNMDQAYNYNEEVHVSFVHKDIKSLVFPTKDGTLNCQTVLQHCIEHVCVALRIPLSECKGPHFLPLFGIVTLPNERIWLPRNHIFKPSCDTPRLFKFKVRFRPPPDYVGHIKTNNNVMWEYLFLQIHDDFLTGRLVESTKLDVKKIFNLLTYALLMPSDLPYDNTLVVNERYRKERRIRLWKITTFLSKSLSSRLITTYLIDHYWISDSLRENTKVLKSKSDTLGNYKKKFYQLIVEAEPNYGSEQYEEVLVGRENEEVTVTIGYYGENQQPALYFGEELQFILSDIMYIKLSLPKNQKKKQWTVTIELKDEKSFELFFKEECAAKSFLSMVQSYFSLYVQYDKQLNTDIQTPESKLSSDIFSFGPLKQSTVEKYLKEPKAPIDTENKCFLIHESLTDFGKYVVVCANKKKRDTKEIIDIKRMELRVNRNQTFTLLGDVEKEITFSDIRAHLKKEFGVQLHPKHYHHISEIEHAFKAEESDMYKDHCKLAENCSNGQIFLPDELDKQRVLIRDKNPFLKKFQVSLDGEKMMLVELQADNGKIAEAFRSGLSDLMKLHKVKPANFMKFYGMVVDKKLCALLEFSQSLDLLTYICEHPQSVPQKVDIMDKVIKIFGVMEDYKLFHGNIRLRKFTVFNGDNRINIKLGDAGIASYLNSEDKNHKDNNERLPWLSPERRLKMKKVTCESECYAVGTTLCEVLYRNDQFAEILKLSDPKDLWQYFEEKSYLPKPDLSVNHGHVKGRKVKDCLICKGTEVLEDVWNLIIMRCWATDPLERPSATDLQKVFSEQIKVKSDALDRDSVTEGLKQVMYDIGLKDEIEENNFSKAKLEEILMTRMKQKFLSEECLSIEQKELGRGYFGVVWEGQIRTPNRNQTKPSPKEQWRKVAVKRFCKREPARGERCSNNTEKSFVQEVILACSLKHRNIVQVMHFSFHHSGAEFSNIVLIMEFMNAGDLRHYAERNKNVESQDHHNQLLKICLDVAEGMVYLSGKAIVHRDLAARNILLARSADGQIVGKISDFGLARKMEENYRFYKNKHLTMVPFAWMPPECLNRSSDDNRFSSDGDVWSFGTLAWEAFSKGKNPKKFMPMLDPGNVEQYLLRQYEKGWRLPKEGNYSDDIYRMMMQCWEFNPKQRPPFVELVESLKGLLSVRQ